MANAEGGTIIVGIETKRVDNVDVSIALKLIKNSEKDAEPVGCRDPLSIKLRWRAPLRLTAPDFS
jgi:hypothetical protein